MWSPDQQRIAFLSGANFNANLFWQPPDGTGTPEPLTDGEPLTDEAETPFPTSFSPDGAKLLYSIVVLQSPSDPSVGWDMALVSLDGAREVVPLLQSSFNERNAEVSPDGRWFAYESDESGRDEVYVRPFPDAESGGRWQVSRDGGTRPVWSADGRELFYLNPPGRVPVEAGDTFSFGNAEQVFDGPYAAAGSLRTYDVSPDGRRFVMIKDVGNVGTSATEIIVVQNWHEELKRLVPVK